VVDPTRLPALAIVRQPHLAVLIADRSRRPLGANGSEFTTASKLEFPALRRASLAGAQFEAGDDSYVTRLCDRGARDAPPTGSAFELLT
jgi:hypothetical protein